MIFKIDATRIDILPVGCPGCQTDHEGQKFFFGGHLVTNIEIIVESHTPIGRKHQHRRTVAQGPRRDDMDLPCPRPIEDHSPDIEIEKIDPVHHHVDPIQK